jgi:hypothetical protein
MGRACSTQREEMKAYRILVDKPEVKRQLGKYRCRWVDVIKMVLREIVWVGLDSIDLTQVTDQWKARVNRIMSLRVIKNVGKFLSS